jgi:nitrous oxidase accessory protein NosD
MGGAQWAGLVDIVITNNSCVGNGWEGIAVPYVQDAKITGNACMSNGQFAVAPHNVGILVHGDAAGGYVNGLLLANNRCGDDQPAKTQEVGVRIDGAGNANIRIVDNDLRGNGALPFLAEAVPQAVVFSGNLG